MVTSQSRSVQEAVTDCQDTESCVVSRCCGQRTEEVSRIVNNYTRIHSFLKESTSVLELEMRLIRCHVNSFVNFSQADAPRLSEPKRCKKEGFEYEHLTLPESNESLHCFHEQLLLLFGAYIEFIVRSTLNRHGQ